MLKKILFYILVLCGCMWVGGLVGFGHTINGMKAVAEKKADAIVVLTGGRNRISAAVELLNRGMADEMLISGVSKGTSLETIKNRKDVNLTSSRAITLDEKPTNTVENAVMASQWMKEHQVKSIWLVTSNYHMPRSMAEFMDNNRDVQIWAYPVYSDNVERKWWTSRHSFWLIASEFNKFMYVWVKTHIGK